jgi:hypothetical protein
LNPSLSTGGDEFPPIHVVEHSKLVRVYLSHAELTQLPIETLHRHEPAQTEIFGKILQLPGVATVIGKPYEVVVQRADLHNWSGIHQKILDLLFLANIELIQPASDAKQ